MVERDPLNGKRVAVLGFGRQGRALARWLPTVGASVIVSDKGDVGSLNGDLARFPEVEFVLGGHPESLLDGVDLLCLSGGVPLDLEIVRTAIDRKVPLSNDAQLFLERCPAPVIGITGSAGKTTTTTLVGRMIEQAGFKAWVGGNTGDVLLDALDQIGEDDRVVMELSSFQLEIMRKSPDLGAVLNITPNHLDRHGTMENYTRAKAQILLHQGRNDLAVLNRDDPGSRGLEPVVSGDLAWFSMYEMVADGAFLVGERLVVSGLASEGGESRTICTRDQLPLRGPHNVANVLAACAIAGTAGIDAGPMAEAIRTFEGVPHRLEVVRVIDDVTYINDSIATAPERVAAALRSFDEPLVLLVGGKDKNLPWDDMLALALTKTRHIIAFGHAGDMIIERLQALGGKAENMTRADSLKDAVQTATAYTQAGDVVLLSPGGTSFDGYRDFAERGEHFRQLVMAL